MPALKGRGRARDVEGHHHLVGIPDVDHPVGVFVRGGDREGAQQLVPMRTQRLKGLLHLIDLAIARDDRLRPALVDDWRVGGIELLRAGILGIAQQEDHLALFAGGKLEADVMCADRLPAVGDRIRKAGPSPRPAARPSRGTAPERPRAGCQSLPAARSRRSRRSDRVALGIRSCDRSRHRRPRPRRWRDCAGSWSGHPRRPTGRTRRPRRPRAWPAGAGGW